MGSEAEGPGSEINWGALLFDGAGQHVTFLELQTSSAILLALAYSPALKCFTAACMLIASSDFKTNSRACIDSKASMPYTFCLKSRACLRAARSSQMNFLPNCVINLVKQLAVKCNISLDGLFNFPGYDDALPE